MVKNTLSDCSKNGKKAKRQNGKTAKQQRRWSKLYVNRKRKMDELRFHIGSFHGTPRKRTRAKVQRPKQSFLQTEEQKKKDNIRAREKEIRLLQSLKDVDPIYARKQFHLMQKPKAFQFGTRPGEICMIYPNTEQQNSMYTRVYNTRRTKTMFEWYVQMYEETQYGNEFIQIANYFYSRNQTIRWCFKRIVLAWLKKHSKSIGDEKDLVTGEPIQERDKIQVYCLKSRCLYWFSGSTLLQSICSNLEAQVNSIPYLQSPKNPYTNVTFGYGQMIHIYEACLQWCVMRRKRVPTSLVLYRNSNCKIKQIVQFHHGFLQYHASQKYMANDDVDLEASYEILQDIFETHKEVLSVNRIVANIPVFRNWFTKDPKNSLIQNWKMFLSDYWFYQQSGIYPRESWISNVPMLADLKTLLTVSMPYLQKHKKQGVLSSL